MSTVYVAKKRQAHFDQQEATDDSENKTPQEDTSPWCMVGKFLLLLDEGEYDLLQEGSRCSGIQDLEDTRKEDW